MAEGDIKVTRSRRMLSFLCVLSLGHLPGCGDDGGAPSRAGGDTSAYPNRGWPVIHHNSRNSDSMDTPGPDDITAAVFHVLPLTGIGAGATVGPEGNVYVGVALGLGAPAEDSCHLFAFDGTTGEQLWCSNEVNDRASTSSPTIDRDGHVYMGDNRAMHSFTREGQVRWSRPIDGFPLSSQFTPDGNLIFITHIGRIYVVRRGDGEPVMEPVVLLPEVTYSPSPLDYVQCFRGSSESECYCANTLSLDQETGAFYFTLTRPGDLASRLVAMRYSKGDPPRIDLLWENSSLEGGSATSPNISPDGTRLYVNDQAGHLLALDANTGAVLWTYDLGFSPLGSPSSSSAGLIIPTGGIGEPFLMAIQDAGDHGELLWVRDDLEARGIAAQRGADRAYAVVNTTARLRGVRLHVIDTRTGETLDDEPVSSTESSTVGTTLSEDGHVYVPGLLGGLWGFAPVSTR
jgi:outer membrane protein assembly factor BamB